MKRKQAIEKRSGAPGCACASSAGGSFSAVLTRRCYVHCATRGSTLHSAGFGGKTKKGNPFMHSVDYRNRWMQEVRSRWRKFAPLRAGVATSSFNFGAAPFRHRLQSARTRYEALAVADELVKRQKIGRDCRCRHFSKTQQPELRVEIDRARAADLGVDTPTSRPVCE